MKTVETTINGIRVKLAAVEQGMRIREARQELGLERGDNYSTSRIDGDDYLDWNDFKDAFPATAQAIENTGINTANIVTVFEIQL